MIDTLWFNLRPINNEIVKQLIDLKNILIKILYVQNNLELGQ